MAERGLRGRRIFVAEDEYLLAEELSRVLESAGAEVLGPVACIEDATSMIAFEIEIHAAILDVNLRGALIFPVADALADRNIPFALTTGYDQWALPERFRTRPRLEKPLQFARIIAVLSPLLGVAG